MSRPLHDLQAERSYLGWVMADNSVLDTHPLTADEFFGEPHAVAFEAMGLIHGRGQHIDSVSLRAELEGRKLLAKAGGDRFLLELPRDLGPMPQSTQPRIRELATLRATRAKILLALQECDDARLGPALELVNEVSDGARLAGQQQILTIGACVEHAIEASRTLSTSTDEPAVVEPTGILHFDEAIHGLDRGDWLTIGADTNVGKSWIALTIALARARKGYRTGIISLEDPKKRWGTRLAAALSGVSSTQLKSRRLATGDHEKIGNAIVEAHQLGIVMAFCLDGNIHRVIDTMRSLVLDHGCTLIEIDYAQNLEGDEGHGETTHTSSSRRYTKIRRALDRLGAALAMFSQVNRSKDPRQGPSRSNLKEGGNIEQKSDHVIMARRDAKRKNVILARIDKSKDPGNGVSWEWEQQRSGLLVESEVVQSEEFADGTPIPKDSDLYERAAKKNAAHREKRKAEQQALPGAAE